MADAIRRYKNVYIGFGTRSQNTFDKNISTLVKMAILYSANTFIMFYRSRTRNCFSKPEVMMAKYNFPDKPSVGTNIYRIRPKFVQLATSALLFFHEFHLIGNLIELCFTLHIKIKIKIESLLILLIKMKIKYFNRKLNY